MGSTGKIMKKRNFVFLFVVMIVSCNYLIDSLTEEDIAQYVKAYDNLAKVSPLIDKELINSQSESIFTCKECRNLMSKAVTDAGYSSFKWFIVMDLRIHYTMRYVLYLQIAEFIGDEAKDIPLESLCTNQKIRSMLDQEQKKKIDENCIHVAALSQHISIVASLINNVAKQLLIKGDLKILGENFDKIQAVISNEKLSEELRSGSGWDD